MPVKEEIVTFLKSLRDDIVKTFETLEPTKRFERECWDYTKGEGGGEMSVIRGDLFEKGAVNFSAVQGDTFPGDDSSGPFFATGVSLITHMQNPFAPTVHFNIRYIETEKGKWLGGGYDLTPMGFPYEEDREHFHQIAKRTLDPHGENLYPEFAANAKDYFFIKHRQKERGVGGIFFDHFNSGDFEKDIAMWKDVGSSFTDTIMPIYQRRLRMAYRKEHKERQLEYRGHYVEFNLVYDRGTQFGFRSGGNTKAILCSLPPLARW